MELVKKQGEYLPHWTLDNSIYHVCFRLYDSVPQSILENWKLERASICDAAVRQNRAITEEEEKHLRILYSDRIDRFLDSGKGDCFLKEKEIAELIVNSLMHFNGNRYDNICYCVMPNHVHVIVKPFDDLFKIIHSWKSYSASMANKILGRKGDFWHRDSYNHIIRNEREFNFQVDYVWKNAEKAGLKNWKYRYMK